MSRKDVNDVDRHVVVGRRLFRSSGRICLGVRAAVKGMGMNWFIIIVTVLCFGYLAYAMIRPERF